MQPQNSQNNSATDDKTLDGNKHQAFSRAKSAEEKSNNCHKLADRKFSAPDIFVFENPQVIEAKVASKNDDEHQSLLWLNRNSICMPPGVSLLNFQVIIQELVKTKMFLKKIENEKESLMREVSSQRKHNQLLKSELEKCKVELLRRPIQSVQLQHEDSFELTSSSQPAPVSHKVKEVADVQKLNEQISQLLKRTQELTRENESLQRSKEEVELLNKKLSEKVGELRHKYEELSQEKHAMEKNFTLQDDRARTHSGDSPHDSSQAFSKSHTSKSSRTAELSSAENSRPLNIAPKAAAFNNLNVDSEAKVSNVQVHECPRCLQNFSNEDSYLKHLQICLE